jgi:hypothetical protein
MDIDSVRAHIYDYYDNSSLGEVEILPLWDGDRGLAGTMTSGEPETPLVYSLSCPLPNPFENKTTISYSIAKPEKVLLCVYDASGRLIRTLVNERKDPGVYSLIWNGCDNNNRDISAGVYFIRLKSGDFKSVRKIILLR